MQFNQHTVKESKSFNSIGKKWEDYETIKCPNGEIIDMSALIREQAKARAALIHLEPMFAAFVNKLNVVYTFHIRTQATDGYHLFVNPQFTAGLTFEEKVFVLAHECMHCLLDHVRRGLSAGHEHMRSNIAADYEVNQTLVDINLFKEATIKKMKALIDKKYSGLSFEDIYNSNPSGPVDNNNNSSEAKKAQQNQGNQRSNNGKTSRSNNGGGTSNDKDKSNDYVAGWNRAMADYKAGKLKIK